VILQFASQNYQMTILRSNVKLSSTTSRRLVMQASCFSSCNVRSQNTTHLLGRHLEYARATVPGYIARCARTERVFPPPNQNALIRVYPSHI